MKYYSIFDKKSELFQSNFVTAINHKTAMRICENLVNSGDKNNFLCLFPSDFQLFCIGDFDENSGIFSSKLELVCELFSLVKRDGD